MTGYTLKGNNSIITIFVSILNGLVGYIVVLSPQ